MRVLHVIESIDPRSGGTSSAFLEIVDALDGHPGCDVRAIAHAPDVTAALQHSTNKSRFEITGPAGQLRAGELARRAMDAMDGTEVVHLHGLWSGDLVRIARAAASRDIPTLWQPHGMLVQRALRVKPLKKRVFMAAGLRGALCRASAIVYCTEGERRASRGAWSGRRSEVVPLPVKCPISEGEIEGLRERTRRRFGLDPDAPAIVFMGRLHPVKRLELTLSALASARREMPGLRLLVFGAGEPDYERFLRERAVELGIGEAVTWAGWIGREDRWEALAAGDCLSINSEFENFGYVIPEALMVGTAVAATRNLSMAEDLEAGGIGAVVEPEPDAMASAYQRLVPLGRDSRERGRRWADEHFAPGEVAGRLVVLYGSILADSA